MRRRLALLLPALLAGIPLLAEAQSTSATAHAPTQATQVPVPTRCLSGGPLPPAGTVAATLGGSSVQLSAPALSLQLRLRPGLYHLQLNDPGTGWQEPFVLGVPRHRSLVQKPLLVLFHAYGRSELSVPALTTYFEEARARGWFAVAPLGAHRFNHSIAYSQANVQAVLDWVLDTFTIDEARVYGVGFSMGGGCVANYAARHLDPDHAILAAVVDHTGSVALDDVYWTAADTSILDNPMMFGGSPLRYPFEYQQASVISYDGASQEVLPGPDLARNLTHTPLYVLHADQDPVGKLVAQSQALHAWVLALGGSSSLLTASAQRHTWDTFDEAWVCDTLAQHTLSLPTSGTHRLLADRDGKWLHYEVEQDAAGAWTPLRWTVDPARNLFALDETKNLKALRVDVQAVNLDPRTELMVVFGAQDGSDERVVLTGYGAPPSRVTRLGQPTVSWSWDSRTGTVELHEQRPEVYPVWRITP